MNRVRKWSRAPFSHEASVPRWQKMIRAPVSTR